VYQKIKTLKQTSWQGWEEGDTRVRGHKHVANSNKHAAKRTGTDPSSPSPPQARPCAGAKTTEGGGWMAGWLWTPHHITACACDE